MKNKLLLRRIPLDLWLAGILMVGLIPVVNVFVVAYVAICAYVIVQTFFND